MYRSLIISNNFCSFDSKRISLLIFCKTNSGGGRYFSSSCFLFNKKMVPNYEKFLNEGAFKRKPSLIREMTKLRALSPESIFMAGGFPNPDLFPFSSLSFKLNSGSTFTLEGEKLKSCLQYQPTLGYPPLQETLKKFQERLHKPPNWSKCDIIVTVGSQQGLCSFFDVVVSAGDSIVLPDLIYSPVLNILDLLSPDYIVAPTDSNGIITDKLEKILDERSKDASKKMPKMIYVNPTGCNPTGVNTSASRKKEIYRISKKFDMLIIDDDPYYFLHFDQENPISFLSLDTDGRVIRFDSFSKVLSGGIRIGFVSAPKELIRKIELHVQSSVLHASSISQVLVDEVLREWGEDGFENHVQSVRKLYKERRDTMIMAAEKYLSGLAEWNIPQGGMFLWIKAHGIKDTYKMVMENGLKEGILLLPGREFSPDRTQPSSYLRASFSIVSFEDMFKGMERLAKLICEEQKHQNSLLTA